MADIVSTLDVRAAAQGLADHIARLPLVERVAALNEARAALHAVSPFSPDPCELAWLAGFWDGEGSIGLVKSKETRTLTVQASHTDQWTIKHVLSVWKKIGLPGRGYTYQERDPSKHRDAHYVRLSGMANVLRFCEAIQPYAVTKARHVELAISWARRRIALAGGLDAKGHLFRGGLAEKRKYTPEELAMAEEFRLLNLRGPASRLRSPQGRIADEPEESDA